MDTHEHTLLWRSADPPAIEHCHVRAARSGWSLEGTLVGALDERPLKITYRTACDRFWRSGMTSITAWIGTVQHMLRFGPDSTGTWLDYAHGEDLSRLAGCVDVDLGFSPATIAVILRRLNLAVGQSAEIVAAWVSFPQLVIEPRRQRYERLSETRYRCDRAGGVSAEIEVDAQGLVIDCAGAWRRVAAAP